MPVSRDGAILVTGGAGFLGSHLCRSLLDDGYRVICLDSFLSGSEANVAALARHPQFSLVRADVCEPPPIDADIGAIYNLACPASPRHYRRDPVGTTRIGVVGAIEMLKFAGKHGARILQASTSEIYGDPQVHPQPESYWGHVNPIGPRACYNEGKRCAETLFADTARQTGLSVRIARIFNTYGPHMDRDDGRVVSNFIVRALAGRPIRLYGNGSQTRAFCYVDDMVSGLRRLMDHDDDRIGPVNLGNPLEITIAELARQIVSLTGSRSPVATAPLPGDDPKQRCPDISLAGAALAWRPNVTLQAGLAATIAWFRESATV